MGARLGLAVLLLLYGFVSVAIAASAPVIFNITIPKSASGFEEEDAYICTTLPLPAQPMKLVGVEPIAKQEIVHHILLFGEVVHPLSHKNTFKCSPRLCRGPWSKRGRCITAVRFDVIRADARA
jgi:peptidylamidoglycolate lyase